MGFDSMPKLAVKILHYLLGFELGFLQGFDHKNGPAVLLIYLGIVKRKVNKPAIP